jgi:hypothetical protein
LSGLGAANAAVGGETAAADRATSLISARFIKWWATCTRSASIYRNAEKNPGCNSLSRSKARVPDRVSQHSCEWKDLCSCSSSHAACASQHIPIHVKNNSELSCLHEIRIDIVFGLYSESSSGHVDPNGFISHHRRFMITTVGIGEETFAFHLWLLWSEDWFDRSMILRYPLASPHYPVLKHGFFDLRDWKQTYLHASFKWKGQV